MKKRIIALVLVIVMAIGVLPANALAASFANTTEGKKAYQKKEVATTFEGYRQALIDYLDASMAYFSKPADYSEQVWSLAQTIYKDEVDRISKMTLLNEVLDLTLPSFFGYYPNPVTLKKATELQYLSDLNLSLYKQENDIEALKNDLREQLTQQLKDYKRSDFNDFYWDRVISVKNDFNESINNISDCLDYVDYQILWSESEIFNNDDFFDDEESDYSADIETILNKYLVSNEEMEDAVYGLEDVFDEYIEEYLPSRGYKGETDELYDIIDKYEQKALKAEYARQILDITNETFAQLISYTHIDPSADLNKPLANNSDKIRLWDKLEKYFLSNYSKHNYSEDGWDSLIEIKDNYQQKIDKITYKVDLKEDTIYNDFIKELAKVKTYAKELKESKTDSISELKEEYLGNPKYNQKKVKPIIVEAIKKINAATKLEQIETLFKTYSKKANATINKYKIITSKSGSGAVSASKSVNYGTNYTVKFVPKAGYKIKAITVDGKKIKLVNSYTFKNIKKSHTVKVTFGK